MVPGEPKRQRYALEFLLRLFVKQRACGSQFSPRSEGLSSPKFVLENRAWLPPTWRGRLAPWLQADQEMRSELAEATVSQVCRRGYTAASWILLHAAVR